VICTGCACLCDDIELENGKVHNACIKGVALIKKAQNTHFTPVADGRKVDGEKAIDEAITKIQNSENFAIYGLDTVPLRAQQIAIDIAKKTEGYIDDASSLCMGVFVEEILLERIKSTTLEEVRDRADFTLYWGADPFNSHPRHISRFTYYPRGQFRQKGWEEDRYLAVVDIRESYTSKLAKKIIMVENDEEFIQSLIDVANGNTPSAYLRDAVELITRIKKSEFGVMFGGLGLRYGLSDIGLLKNLLDELNNLTEFYFIPMGCHPNMRGFNELLFASVGELNSYSFRDGIRDSTFSFSSLLTKEQIDTILIVGADPVASLPFEIASKIAKANVILLDPCPSYTSKIADVVIPTSVSGIGAGGEMIRIDGKKIKFEAHSLEEITDEYVLKRIEEAI